MTAAQQLAMHIAMMNSTVYTTLPTIKPGLSTLLKLTNRRTLAAAFLNKTDVRDTKVQGATKPIHALGVSAPVEVGPTLQGSQKYTGIFNSGGVGIIRMSRATTTSAYPFTPGLAIKVFVDGGPSVNFHAMFSLDGQGTDTNIFKNSFTTAVSSPHRRPVQLLAFFFKRAIASISRDPSDRPLDERTLSLLEAARVKSDGTVVNAPTAPKILRFDPQVSTLNLGVATTAADDDFRRELINHVDPSSILYKIMDEDDLYIGDVRLTGPFVASSHGDNMFFKHQAASGHRCPV